MCAGALVISILPYMPIAVSYYRCNNDVDAETGEPAMSVARTTGQGAKPPCTPEDKKAPWYALE
jgi:hypothetical protein